MTTLTFQVFNPNQVTQFKKGHVRPTEDIGGPNAKFGQRVENPRVKPCVDEDGSEKIIHIRLFLLQHTKEMYNFVFSKSHRAKKS